MDPSKGYITHPSMHNEHVLGLGHVLHPFGQVRFDRFGAGGLVFWLGWAGDGDWLKLDWDGAIGVGWIIYYKRLNGWIGWTGWIGGAGWTGWTGWIGLGFIGTGATTSPKLSVLLSVLVYFKKRYCTFAIINWFIVLLEKVRVCGGVIWTLKSMLCPSDWKINPESPEKWNI